MNNIYDVIIIGAGPAGLCASIYAKRAGLKSIVIDKSPIAGGQIMNTYEIENYLGMDLLSGMELAAKFTEHANRLGMNLVIDEVKKIENNEKYSTIYVDNDSYMAKFVIIATGATHRKLNISGEDSLRGRGVSYCATCDGAFFKEKTAAVIGGGDVALEDAIFLSRFCQKVYLIHRRDKLRGAAILQEKMMKIDKIEVIWDTIPIEIIGDEKVKNILLKNVKNQKEEILNIDAIFVAVGIQPDTQIYKDLLDLNEGGYILTDKYCKTNIDNIYACGDIRDTPLRQVITAAADGAVAISHIAENIS